MMTNERSVHLDNILVTMYGIYTILKQAPLKNNINMTSEGCDPGKISFQTCQKVNTLLLLPIFLSLI